MKTKLAIFGITGDLARRKLLPSLRKIVKASEIDDLTLIGVSRQPVAIEQLVGYELAPLTTMCQIDPDTTADYTKLKKHIALKNNEQLVVYLSVPPRAATLIADYLGKAGLNTPNVKILFEKPFGVDLASAEDMVRRTDRYFSEDQIYRIDHYLAKEMAQNIVTFRSGNAIFRQLWNRQSIERIEVVALEEYGIEGRVHFYDGVGALRDVVQGHLLQLLSLVLMDIPSTLDWSRLPSLRQHALERVLSADPSAAIRAQYIDYADEVKKPTSQTETFVALELVSDATNWEGVPIHLVTGKALDRKTTEIRVYFRASSIEQTNCLRFNIQPDEGVEIDLYTKRPGYERSFETKKLQFKYPEDTELPDAYEQVIVDAVLSRRSLFTGGDEILESWRILQPLLDAWLHDTAPIMTYPRGSSYEEIIAARH